MKETIKIPLDLTKVVIDTNVFIHAQTKNNCKQAAKAFLTDIVESKIIFYLDEDNIIEAEYEEKMRNMVPGFGKAAYSKLLKRKVYVPRKIPRKDKKFIQQTIRGRDSETDRTFVIVAYNSDAKFVSHDFSDFPVNIRAKLDKCIHVIVPCSGSFYNQKYEKCVSCTKWRISIPQKGIRC